MYSGKVNITTSTPLNSMNTLIYSSLFV